MLDFYVCVEVVDYGFVDVFEVLEFCGGVMAWIHCDFANVKFITRAIYKLHLLQDL